MGAGAEAARRRRRVAVLAVAAAAAGALGGWLDRGPSAPPDRAASLVPADALVYVHLSTDSGRAPERRLDELLSRLPSYRNLRERIELAVSRRAGGFEFGRDVRPWLGDEAAVALLAAGGAAADTLVLLSVDDEPKAQGLLMRAAGARPAVLHRGIVIRRFGNVSAAFAAGFLVLGQERGVRRAIDLARAGGRPLAAAPGYLAATRDRPDDRAMSTYASRDGVRRVLRAQPGLAGALGALVDHPRLRALGLTVVPEDEGLRVLVRRVRTGGASRTFSPELLDAVPQTAVAYLGLAGLDAVASLVPASGAAALLGRLRAALPRDAGVELERDVLAPLRGEVALWVAPALPAPVITLVSRTSDAAGTREALGRLQGVIAQLAVPAAEERGAVPTFEERDIGGGVKAHALEISPGLELVYAVFDGRVVVSTSTAGVQQVRARGESLREGEAFRRAVGEAPADVEALLFFDLGQLLALGDQTGLTSGPALSSVRDDLRRLRVIGVVARREGNDTTAELFLEIP